MVACVRILNPRGKLKCKLIKVLKKLEHISNIVWLLEEMLFGSVVL